MKTKARTTVIPCLEVLEPRQAPSTSPWLVQTFDGTPLGHLPAGWSQWSNSGAAAFSVVSEVGGTRDLAANASTSTLSARTWVNTLPPVDVEASVNIYLNSLIPAEVLVRGSNLNTAVPTFYAVAVTRGLQVQLLRVVQGRFTVLGHLQSADYVTGEWITVSLTREGSFLGVQVRLLDTGKYLTSNGHWQMEPTWALSRTDTAITDNGLVGLARGASAAGKVDFDNFIVQNADPLPEFPRHYSYIRIAELAYSNNPMGAFEDQLLTHSVDLVVPASSYLADIASVTPNTPRLVYSNVSNLYLDLLTSWFSYADSHGLPREDAFFHALQALPFSGNSPSSQPVNWFWRVFEGGSTWSDLTSKARGTQTGGVSFGGAGQSLYVGYPDRFREINLSLLSRAAAGWSVALEYPTAVDSYGRPTAWGILRTLSNTTAGLTRSGQILFDPPSNWKPASINGSARLYYVRFATVSAGTAPVARTILGRDYVNARGTTSGVIPAFDASADLDHDGYLNNAEYARRRPGMDARFLYETRVSYGSYGQMRFATNPSYPGFRNWAVDYSLHYLNGLSRATGLFMDNSTGKPAFDPAKVRESTSSFTSDYGNLLQAINKAIDPRWILANTVGGGNSANAVIQQTHAYFEEFAIRALAHNYQQFLDLATTVARRNAQVPEPYAILDSLPTGGSVTDPRTQLATLAYYYLLSDPVHTFLDIFGGYAPSTSWSLHWIPAINYNVGLPSGSWFDFATGLDPANRNLTYHVYARHFGHALVLYKPLSYASGVSGTLAYTTATTHSLGGTYRPLNADGTLGPAVTSITLRNGQGAILIKA
jgi:hypothetical protein